MLIHLHVKNLALIEDIEVEFGPGLNILTGETGAGKSVLLGSMQLILGGRTARDMIRTGASCALVELLFQVENKKAEQFSWNFYRRGTGSSFTEDYGWKKH